MTKIKVGQKYRMFFAKGHPMNKLMHIRTIVDENYIVYRWYGKHRQWWHYEIEHIQFFEFFKNSDRLKLVK